MELLQRLTMKLDTQVGATGRNLRYFEGHPDLAFASDKYRSAFGRTLRALSVNWARLVVDSMTERLNVNGFRSAASQDGDPDAWGIWQGVRPRRRRDGAARRGDGARQGVRDGVARRGRRPADHGRDTATGRGDLRARYAACRRRGAEAVGRSR